MYESVLPQSFLLQRSCMTATNKHASALLGQHWLRIAYKFQQARSTILDFLPTPLYFRPLDFHVPGTSKYEVFFLILLQHSSTCYNPMHQLPELPTTSWA